MELIHNGIIVNENLAQRGFIVINGGFIACVGPGEPSQQLTEMCDTVTDVEGAYIIPGVIDDHVHMREPGLTHKATIASESRAAVAGGITSYMEMPNVKPATTTLEALHDKMERAQATSVANYSFYIGATNDNLDVIRQVDYSRTCGVKVFMGSSTGGMLVNDAATLRSIFSEVKAVVAVHCEDEDIIAANRQALVEQRGDDLPVTMHTAIRSEEACYNSTRRAVELARECGTRLHVLHISTERELELFDDNDSNITCEACVGHLWFSDEDYARLGNRIKVNPSIKTTRDREALRNAVASGLINVVATDHAPHLPAEKEGNCITAASGMPMAQFLLPTMMELVEQGVLTIETVVERMCHAPARLFKIHRRGFLRAGFHADIVVVKRNDTPHVVTDDDVLSTCGWTPLNGTPLHHQVVMTYVNGHRAWDNGTLSDEIHSHPLKFVI
ncbi:MAG: dihydroorotase [Muribaculaceae bacterium]|nr:dihydroorotase [Muribaculaceae bacterium]